MSSSSALKYNVTVSPSYYAGIVVFLLYIIVISFSLLLISFSIIACVLYLILLFIASYAAYKAYLQKAELLLSESGLIESVVEEKRTSGKIGLNSFYNGLFIFLQLDITDSVFTKKSTKQFIFIYKDAVNEEQYRLLARLINSGRS